MPLKLGQVWGKQLVLLVGRSEACCGDEGLPRWSKGWEEGGRKFKLESKESGAWRFLHYIVVTPKFNRFSLIFPKRERFP